MNLDVALELIQKAIKVAPDNAAYLDSLGWVYYKKAMYDKALEILRKADELLKDPVIYDHLGDVCYKINQTDEAIKYWELSLKLAPDQQDIKEKINNVKNSHVSRQ